MASAWNTDSTLEEHRVLRDDSHGWSEISESNLGHVYVVYSDPSRLELVQAEEGRDYGGLAGSRPPHDPNLHTGVDGQVQFAEHQVLRPIIVAKVDLYLTKKERINIPTLLSHMKLNSNRRRPYRHSIQASVPLVYRRNS